MKNNTKHFLPKQDQIQSLHFPLIRFSENKLKFNSAGILFPYISKPLEDGGEALASTLISHPERVNLVSRVKIYSEIEI